MRGNSLVKYFPGGFMKVHIVLRLLALGGMVAILLMWGVAISAADPAGDTPANGIPEASAPVQTCSSQTVAAGAQIWLKVAYHAGTDLEMHVMNGDGVNFDVYSPMQVANFPTLPAQPTGRLLPDRNDAGYTNTWLGDLGIAHPSDFYYVLVTNTNASPVTFSFCTIEMAKFIPPPHGGPPSVSTTTDSGTSDEDGIDTTTDTTINTTTE
jgi:hypothetical protein